MLDGRKVIDKGEKIRPPRAESTEDVAQKNIYVWYASYGSNLLEERFNCYLFGGQVHGISKYAPGARDPTPAKDSVVLRKPYRVFFAHARTSFWGFGGVAMLDLTPNDSHECLLRLYQVTLQQFNDILAQENGILPPLPPRHWLTCEDLGRLRRTGPGSSSVQFPDGLSHYPTVVYLGEHNGSGILSFTCHSEEVSGFLSSELPVAPPAENYLNVLRKGVQELDQDDTDPIAYWDKFIKVQFEPQFLN